MTAHDPLTPPARTLCDAMSATFPDPADGPLDADTLRAAARAGLGRPSVPMRSVTERLVPAPDLDAPVRVRIYEPEPESESEHGSDGPRPLVVFLHGGGWVLCDLDTHDGLCRQLAALARALVVSVDYRRAPEHPFPAAFHDAYAVARWAAAHASELGCDPDRLFVAGDSSGGNLAAGVALRALGDPADPAVAGQLLLYPVLDHRLGGESPVAFERGFFHTTAHMRWYWEQYLGADGDPVAASPGLAPDLEGLPPALVLLADCDPLRDEGLAYARRLARAGVRAEVALYPGVFHGFLGAAGFLPEADAALARAAAWLAHTPGARA
ncbi:alpha/beta hydrolase [Streptomyces sp. NPDC048156]|uniref:alpha/beta hydrolase n=1 Tax=Streptomyces sp. NPDC048156 TaxID=3365502 RepID=UPI00371CF222